MDEQHPEARIGAAPDPMTPDEAKAIVEYYAKRPDGTREMMELFPRLSDQEKATLVTHLPVSAGAPGVSPGLLTGVGSTLAKYGPALARGSGRAVAGGAGAGIGAMGVDAIAKALGVPQPVANFLSMIGGMAGAHLGSGAVLGPSAATAAAEAAPGVRRVPVPEGSPSMTMPPERGGTIEDIFERVLGGGAKVGGGEPIQPNTPGGGFSSLSRPFTPPERGGTMSDIMERVMGGGVRTGSPAPNSPMQLKTPSHEVSVPAEGVVTPGNPPFDHSEFLDQLKNSVRRRK